jgi:hypothetical protein
VIQNDLALRPTWASDLTEHEIPEPAPIPLVERAEAVAQGMVDLMKLADGVWRSASQKERRAFVCRVLYQRWRLGNPLRLRRRVYEADGWIFELWHRAGLDDLKLAVGEPPKEGPTDA